MLDDPQTTAAGKKLDLQTFMIGVRQDVDRFETDWKKQHAKAPQDWPDRMEESEWHEQLMMFLSGEGA